MAEEFMIFIIEPEWDESNATRDDWVQVMKDHNAFAEAVKAAGAKIEDTNPLSVGADAVKIRPARDGSPAQFTDGPFSETKEIVSGYYLITARDKEQAKEIAALCPTRGWIELYPIADLTNF